MLFFLFNGVQGWYKHGLTWIEKRLPESGFSIVTETTRWALLDADYDVSGILRSHSWPLNEGYPPTVTVQSGVQVSGSIESTTPTDNSQKNNPCLFLGGIFTEQKNKNIAADKTHGKERKKSYKSASVWPWGRARSFVVLPIAAKAVSGEVTWRC